MTGVTTIRQGKAIEGIKKIREKVLDLISRYEDLIKENKLIRGTASKVENELKDKLDLFSEMDKIIKTQEKKISDLENSLNGYEILQIDNIALKDNLKQLSLEFQSTKDELHKIKSHSEQQYVGARQQIDSVKVKIKEMIFKIDDTLYAHVN